MQSTGLRIRLPVSFSLDKGARGGNLAESDDPRIGMRLVAPPRRAEFSFTPSRLRTYWIRLRRGSVALEVSMPARFNPRFMLVPLVTFAIIGATLALFAALIAPEAIPWIGYSTLFAWLVSLLVWMLRYRPTAKREVLEVDSRVFVLGRDEDSLLMWDRQALDDIRVASSEHPEKVANRRMLGGEPTIVWGDSGVGRLSGGCGASLTREEAVRVVERIKDFENKGDGSIYIDTRTRHLLPWLSDS